MNAEELKQSVSKLIDLTDIARKYRKDERGEIDWPYFEEVLDEHTAKLREHFGIVGERIT